ncbi:bifunctional diguanylate cyclase/phosphodiesterase [Ancylobacter sp. TS-1]|uniref:putative bifunctional diguanylate cyclase/phosphodiesterase n=1 Tax=Ancylobacter sp. TS-1 TaxID=1850374 RepID=UPI0013907B0E|nr:EAL domain-containing protein [Ancylobacter sp. TS-1]
MAGFLDSMLDALAVFDAQDRLVFHNRRFVELFPFLEPLGDLQGLTFYALASVPSGEWRWVNDPEIYLKDRLRRHAEADGAPFLIPLENGGWVQAREHRTPDSWIVATWSDVSRLKETEARLQDAIDSVAAGLILLDSEGRITLTNSGMRQILATPDATLEPGRPLSDLLDEAVANGIFAGGAASQLAALATPGPAGEVPMEIPLHDGRWILASHRPLGNGGVVGIWTDLTAQKKREAELVAMREQLRLHTEALADFARLIAQQARNDMLTALPNRFALEERLDHLLRDGETTLIWVGVIDIDHFSGINDALGHATADELLRETGRFLRGLLRTDDTLARVGADEFAIVLTGLDESEVTSIANRLNSAVQSHVFHVGGSRLSVTVSVGLTMAQDKLRTPSSLLAAADTACRVAKESGRDRVQLYDVGDPKMRTSHQRVSWAERIRLGLELDRFRLHLQAIVDRDGNVCGYEALIRLKDSDNVCHSPGQFLPAARRLGLMCRIDSWVCHQCVDFAMRLLAAGNDQYVSMNLGVQTLSNTTFQRKLLDLIAANPGVEKTLRIEITETDDIHDAHQAASFIVELRACGLHVYLDDFGNGYNSFEVLKQLPVDGIKIDWTVTRDLLSDPIDEAQIRAAVSITDSLGLELIVEGVEEERQLIRLRELGATLFQGFYFHRPVNAETLLG